MIDPLEQALDCIARSVEERAALQRRLNTTLTENHQLRRQLERAREANQSLDDRYGALEHELHVAQLRVEQAERATREHAGRTT